VFDDAQVEAAMASMFEDESDDPDVELGSEEEEELASMPADGGAGIKEKLAALAEQLKRGMMDGLEASANEKLREVRAALPRRPFVPPPGRRHHAVMYVQKADTDKRWPRVAAEEEGSVETRESCTAWHIEIISPICRKLIYLRYLLFVHN
jgi:hypothetical protein